ncbi:MAG: CHASE2 domain-containing protein [Desulfobulbaceae bacterium]|nr:CHASE2 domain-containing protein [Desulfobulbaceae bacterium]
MLNRLSVLIISITLFGLFQLGGVVSSLSDKALDILFLLRGPVEPSQEIIIIGVDEESLAALGAWPFPRKHHAELLERLGKAGVIGFDFLFSEPTEQDELFDAAVRSSPPVVLASAHNSQNHILRPVPSLSGYFGSGHIEIILGRDGVVREAGAFHQSGQPSLPAFAQVMLKGAGMARDLTAASKPILINHYGPENTFLYLSYFDVLQGTFPDDFFKNRFVLIGAEALGIGDSHVTPFSRQHSTPGVEIQATILNNLLDDTWLKPLPAVSWFFMAYIAVMSIFVWPTRGENWNLVINLSLASLLTFSSVFLFRLSLFLDPAPALLFLTLTFLVYLVTERLWTAKKIFNEMSRLDRQLETRLQQVYTNIPTQFFNLEPSPTTGGIRRHLSHLQASVKILSLQHHFIENLLREELPPLPYLMGQAQ